MASKDKPIVRPTYQSIREKVGSIPARMATRFAEEAKNEMNRIKSGKASSYETESMSKRDAKKDFINLAKDEAKKAMEKGKAALDNSMRNEMNRLKSGKASSYEVDALERASKKKN